MLSNVPMQEEFSRLYNEDNLPAREPEEKEVGVKWSPACEDVIVHCWKKLPSSAVTRDITIRDLSVSRSCSNVMAHVPKREKVQIFQNYWADRNVKFQVTTQFACSVMTPTFRNPHT